MPSIYEYASTIKYNEKHARRIENDRRRRLGVRSLPDSGSSQVNPQDEAQDGQQLGLPESLQSSSSKSPHESLQPTTDASSKRKRSHDEGDSIAKGSRDDPFDVDDPQPCDRPAKRQRVTAAAPDNTATNSEPHSETKAYSTPAPGEPTPPPTPPANGTFSASEDLLAKQIAALAEERAKDPTYITPATQSNVVKRRKKTKNQQVFRENQKVRKEVLSEASRTYLQVKAVVATVDARKKATKKKAAKGKTTKRVAPGKAADEERKVAGSEDAAGGPQAEDDDEFDLDGQLTAEMARDDHDGDEEDDLERQLTAAMAGDNDDGDEEDLRPRLSIAVDDDPQVQSTAKTAIGARDTHPPEDLLAELAILAPDNGGESAMESNEASQVGDVRPCTATDKKLEAQSTAATVSVSGITNLLAQVRAILARYPGDEEAKEQLRALVIADDNEDEETKAQILAELAPGNTDAMKEVDEAPEDRTAGHISERVETENVFEDDEDRALTAELFGEDDSDEETNGSHQGGEDSRGGDSEALEDHPENVGGLLTEVLGQEDGEGRPVTYLAPPATLISKPKSGENDHEDEDRDGEGDSISLFDEDIEPDGDAEYESEESEEE